MFPIKYFLNQSNHNSHIEFGIDVLKGGKLIKSIPSISDNQKDIEKIILLCNELDIELCHLDNIIEDYLTDFSI